MGSTRFASLAFVVVCVAACSGKIDPGSDLGSSGGGGPNGGSTSGGGSNVGSADPDVTYPGPGGAGAGGSDPSGPSGGVGGVPGGGPGGPGGPGSAPCFTADIGSGCSKEVASSTCSAKGYVVTAIGKTSGGTCTVTCCPATPPPPPPPPPGPTPACTWITLGNGSTCMSWSDVKTKGTALCSSLGAQLVSASAGTNCPGGTTSVQLQCCVLPPKK